ncbi:MAG: TonB-dependent receptor, partial [Acidobacteriota bacterium]
MLSKVLGFIALAGFFSIAAGFAQSEQQGKEEQKKQEKQSGQSQQPIQGPSTSITVAESIREIPTESITAAKMPVSIRHTPASISVVSGSLIESQDGVVLGDAIRNVSGVNVGTGFGVFDFFTIRGFDNLSTGLVMTDGAREPESTFYQMYNIDRVEVLKGPSSFLWGANSLAGTVNLVRKRPLFSGNFGEVGFSFGSFQDYQGTFDVNVVDPSGAIAFRFNGLYRDSENYRDDKQSYLGAFNPAMTWRISDRSELTLNFEYVKNEFKPDAGLPLFNNQIPDLDRRNSYQSPFDISEQNIVRFRADWTHRLSDRATFHNKFYFTSLDWRSDGTLFVAAFPNQQGSLEAARVFTSLNDLQQFTGNQSEFLLTFQTGSLRHQLLAGLELAQLQDQFDLGTSFLPSIDLFNPVETADRNFLFPIPGQFSAGDARSIIVAPYFLDRITFSDTVQVFAGGRYDYIDHQDPLNNISRSDGQFSPMAGIVITPSEPVSLYASVGKAFRPPSTLILEEDRRPEESTQFEVG